MCEIGQGGLPHTDPEVRCSRRMNHQECSISCMDSYTCMYIGTELLSFWNKTLYTAQLHVPWSLWDLRRQRSCTEDRAGRPAWALLSEPALHLLSQVRWPRTGKWTRVWRSDIRCWKAGRSEGTRDQRNQQCVWGGDKGGLWVEQRPGQGAPPSSRWGSAGGHPLSALRLMVT